MANIHTKYILGIDPGKSGAWCVLSMEGAVAALRKSGDVSDLAALLASWAWELRPPVAYVEQVHAGGTANAAGRTMGASSAFTFGRGYGMILGALAALRVRTELVTPQKWKRSMGEIGHDKRHALEHAHRLHPDVTIPLYAADAVLIAEYGRRREAEALAAMHEDSP